jgi:hypothetical protein
MFLNDASLGSFSLFAFFLHSSPSLYFCKINFYSPPSAKWLLWFLQLPCQFYGLFAPKVCKASCSLWLPSNSLSLTPKGIPQFPNTLIQEGILRISVFLCDLWLISSSCWVTLSSHHSHFLTKRNHLQQGHRIALRCYPASWICLWQCNPPEEYLFPRVQVLRNALTWRRKNAPATRKQLVLSWGHPCLQGSWGFPTILLANLHWQAPWKQMTRALLGMQWSPPALFLLLSVIGK